MIRNATFLDIDAIIKITKACATLMIANGIFQWNEQYPNKTTFETDVERKELFVLEEENKIIGCVVVSNTMDDEYYPIKWLTENQDNVYIHRLAVHPDYRGKGFAQKLMDFAEMTSRNNQMKSVRLDTFSANKRNQKFYELRGYEKTGAIYFPKQSESPFYCYELIL